MIGFLFSATGRLNRSKFWLGVLTMIALTILLSIIALLLGFGTSHTTNGSVQVDDGTSSSFSQTSFVVAGWASVVISLIVSVPMTFIGVKRRHDRNSAGYDVVAFSILNIAVQALAAAGFDGPVMFGLNIVLFVWGMVLFVLLGCLSGTRGDNSFGPDPLGRTALQG